MSVIHLYPDNGEIACTTKEAFVGKEVRLKELPPLSRLFSDEVEGVVFRLPAVLKSRKIKPILFALASLVCGKYYKTSITKSFENFLNHTASRDLFFIGNIVCSEIMTFHYVNDGDVVIQGAETVNLIQKNNASLQKLLPKIVPSDNKKKLFIVGLFSLDLLKFLKRKFPLCDFEIRYYDVIKTDQLPSVLS